MTSQNNCRTQECTTLQPLKITILTHPLIYNISGMRQRYINPRHFYHHCLAYIVYFLHNATVSSWITQTELKSICGLHSVLNPLKQGRSLYKGRFIGPSSALQPYRLIVPLAPMSSLIHLHRRHVPHRHERHQPAKEGTNTRNFASTFVIHGGTRFFYMPQSWDMGQILSPPLRRNACWGF
jgi:hypothetical protein